MNRFRDILAYPAGLHRSDPAIETAADLARRTGASLTVVSVVSPDGQLFDARLRKRRARLDSLTAQLRLAGISATNALLTSSSPAAALVEQVRRAKSDLVVKTARRGVGREARAFSSIAKSLLRTCPCAVWTVRRKSRNTNRIVLAAIAPYHHDEESERLDRDVLDVAARLAEIRGARLHIASVWTPFGAGFVNHSVTQSDYAGYARASELAARRALAAFVAPHDVATARIHMRQGHPGEMVSAIASDLDAELIVVGAAGRTGIERWIFGNTVDTVLDASASAVLGVRDIGSPRGALAS